jgi:hypothetical protein
MLVETVPRCSTFNSNSPGVSMTILGSKCHLPGELETAQGAHLLAQSFNLARQF